MSSWKKASKSNQKVHRERHQPEARQHLGLLEKKRDYKTRARNVQNKEKVLKFLHQRALDKNPDEFYHHMIKSKLDDGVHHERKQAKKAKDANSSEQFALMKTQDTKYIQMKRTMEHKKIERLQSQLHMIDYANTVENKHIFFVDGEEIKDESFDLAKHLDTHPSLLGRKTNRPRMEDLSKLNIPELTPEEIKAANALKQKSYQELTKRIERERELAIAQRKLEMQRVLRQPRQLKPQKLSSGTKNAAPVYVFKYERKK